MNILHLISSGGYYGAENVMVSVAESLENHDCCSTIAVFDHPRGRNEELVYQAQRRGLPVVRIPCRGRWDHRAVRGIREVVESLSIDIVHSHGYKTDTYSYLAARSLGIPLVATCHNWTHDSAAVRIYEFLDAMVLRAFDAVVVVSENMVERLQSAGIAKSKIRMIDNGVDLLSLSLVTNNTDPKRLDEGKLMVGTVGRLVPLKGLTYFLQAASEVLLEFSDVRFVIVGSGPDREKLQRMVCELGIEGSVRFMGHCAEMSVAYASMDIFVLASIVEAMPMVILEALAAKKPVIATSVGAVPSMIESEKTGLLVPPKDVQALKLAMLRLLRDPSLRKRLANAGQAEVSHNHSRQVMAEKYLHLYQELAKVEVCEQRLGTPTGTYSKFSHPMHTETDDTHVHEVRDMSEAVRSNRETS